MSTYDLPEEIDVEADGPIRVVRLNRPDHLNAANHVLHQGRLLPGGHLAEIPNGVGKVHGIRVGEDAAAALIARRADDGINAPVPEPQDEPSSRVSGAARRRLRRRQLLPTHRLNTPPSQQQHR